MQPPLINYGAASSADRLRGIGAALLSRFESDPGNFSQTISQPSLASQGGKNAYQVSLDLMTASGTKVTVFLQTTATGLTAQVTSGGRLSETERGALSGLAEAFQHAIDGIGSSAKLDVGGLLRYDTEVLSSIDLNARVQLQGGEVQTLELHADSKVRKLSINGPDGNVNVSMDLSRLAAMGNAQQRKAGMEAYLAQVREAAGRGHANASVLTTFNDAFEQIVGEPSTNSASNLSPHDLARLSGLADFDASLSTTPIASNLLRQEEIDKFSYQISQTTKIAGQSQFNRAILQKQNQHLDASFHQALPDSEEAQSYYFKTLTEDTTSDTHISYSSGALVTASTEQTTSGAMSILKYVMGALSESSKTPLDHSVKRDLMKLH